MNLLSKEGYDPPGAPGIIQSGFSFPFNWRRYEESARDSFGSHGHPTSIIGYRVPTRFRIGLPNRLGPRDSQRRGPNPDRACNVEYSRSTESQMSFTDYCGLRFPTLDTSRNSKYWKVIAITP
ncbi:hypothetical protein BdWA1_000465 [Babesia duncani]|uniref:Uncharacterized protein n=1 Tax=Babesia duncani TaxID=323732 RepID=A0AAD9PM90_9APIC|nr:hypothetical protein BdWA1_000465 [Babesia duncani]